MAPNLSEMVATTLDRYSRQIADNVSKHNALLSRLNRRGNIRSVSGGTKILQELDYQENSTFKWYTGYETLDISASDVLTAAEFEWKQANANVVISGREQMINAESRERIHDLLRSRITNAQRTLQNNIATALFHDGTDGKKIGGLQLLIADDPSSGTVGGIDRANWPFWRNQVYDFNDELSSNADETNIQKGMNKLWIRTTRGTDRPDLIVMDPNYFTFYLESLQDQKRFQSDEMADAGFMSLKYMSSDVVFDDQAPADHGYFLNTDFLFFRPHSQRNFRPLRERQTVQQDALVTPMVWMGNMTMSNASLQGVMHS